MKRILTKARIVFGWFYFLLHSLMLAFAVLYMYLSLTVSPGGPEAIVFVAVPVLGLFVGHWMRQGQFDIKRIVLMVLSGFFSLSLICFAFFLPAVKKKKPTAPMPQQMMRAVDLELLTCVARNDYQGLVKAINAGANVNAQTGFGDTALHLTKDKKIAQYLIEKGADVNLKNFEFGMTPLFYQDVKISELLIQSGADVNARGKSDNTPLTWYSYSGYLDGVKFLFSHGADLNARNSDGSTALDIAISFGHPQLAEFLKSRGAKTGRATTTSDDLETK